MDNEMNMLGRELVVNPTRNTALISVRPDGFVDGASYSGQGDAEFIGEAQARGFKVETVDRDYAKRVVFTYIAQDGELKA